MPISSITKKIWCVTFTYKNRNINCQNDISKLWFIFGCCCWCYYFLFWSDGIKNNDQKSQNKQILHQKKGWHGWLCVVSNDLFIYVYSAMCPHFNINDSLMRVINDVQFKFRIIFFGLAHPLRAMFVLYLYYLIANPDLCLLFFISMGRWWVATKYSGQFWSIQSHLNMTSKIWTVV